MLKKRKYWIGVKETWTGGRYKDLIQTKKTTKNIQLLILQSEGRGIKMTKHQGIDLTFFSKDWFFSRLRKFFSQFSILENFLYIWPTFTASFAWIFMYFVFVYKTRFQSWYCCYGFLQFDIKRWFRYLNIEILIKFATIQIFFVCKKV